MQMEHYSFCEAFNIKEKFMVQTKRSFYFSKYKLFIISIFLCLFFSSCGSGLDGTYSDQAEMMKYKFEPGGKVYISSFMGAEVELDYEVDGNKVKIGGPEGKIILTLLENGSIQGPMDVVLTKKVDLDLILKEESSLDLNGTYSGQTKSTNEAITLTFKSGGKVYMYLQGVEGETELKYKVDGNKVMVTAPEGNFEGNFEENEENEIFTLLKNGSLLGPHTGLLTKEK